MSLSTPDAIALLRGLRQVRQLRPDPLPAEVLADILEVARWTGSARNVQPWELVVLEDREVLRTIAGLEGGRGPHLANAAVGLVLVMAGNQEHPEWDTYDEGRLAERIMLAAAAHGVGSAIGWFTEPAEAIKTMLGIPRERLVRTIVSLGYVDEQQRQRRPRPEQPRKSLAEMVHRGRFSS